MKSFLIDSFIGLSEYENKGIAGAFKHGSALDVRRRIDSLTCQRGAKTTITGFDGPIQKIEFANNNVYYFQSNGKIRKSDLNGSNLALVYTDSESIYGAGYFGLDTGKNYLWWATPTKLHCKEIPGLSNWTDVDALATYPKTNLTYSNQGHLIKVVNGNLYICNKDKIALVGYDGSYTNNALQLPVLDSAKTIIERGKYMIIGTQNISDINKGAVYSWDCISDNYNDRINVSGNTIDAMVDTEIPILISKGSIYYNDMISSVPLIRIPGGGYISPEAIVNVSNMAYLAITGNSNSYNGVFSYGRKNKNSPFVLNYEYPLPNSEGTENDYPVSLSSNWGNLYVSINEAPTYSVKIYEADVSNPSANYETATFESLDLKAPNKLPGEKTVWGLVKLFTSSLPTGCKIELYYRVNKNGSFVQAKMEGGTTQYTTTNGQEAVFEIGAEGDVFEVKLVLTPSGTTTPEVHRIQIYFD